MKKNARMKKKEWWKRQANPFEQGDNMALR